MMQEESPTMKTATAIAGFRASAGPLMIAIMLATLAASTGSAWAQGSFPYVVRKADEPDVRKPMKVLVPYALATESLGGVLGLGGGMNLGREPGTAFGTAFGSSNGSFLLMGGTANVAIPYTQRFFIDAVISTGRGAERQLYVDGEPPTTDAERSGSNESDPDDFLTEDTYEARIQVDFKYVMPWGEGKDEPVHKYFVQDGFLIDGASGGSWNPLKSGRTTLSLRPQYWDQFIDPEGADVALRTMNFALEAEYDNRDFRPNPSRGSYLRLAGTKDWGWLNDTEDWYMLEAEYSKYVPMGTAPFARQQILAFNAATVTTPSWETTGVDGRPPYFTGATLGGLDRMKAYPEHRFHDNALVYYAAEYRMIPSWKKVPLKSALKFMDIQWWQFVVFGELGRVAPSWNLSTLHSDMKWDAGAGIRGMFGSGVARIDLAYGEEGFNMAAMFGQSF